VYSISALTPIVRFILRVFVLSADRFQIETKIIGPQITQITQINADKSPAQSHESLGSGLPSTGKMGDLTLMFLQVAPDNVLVLAPCLGRRWLIRVSGENRPQALDFIGLPQV
jgi:hypothetical protein